MTEANSNRRFLNFQNFVFLFRLYLASGTQLYTSSLLRVLSRDARTGGGTLLLCLQGTFSQIMSEVQKLLVLLTACVASSHAASLAASELQREAALLQITSQEAHMHLLCMSDVVQLMADTSATAADVEVAVRQLKNTMLVCKEQAAHQVQMVCSELLANLSKEEVALSFAVDQPQLSGVTTLFKTALCRAWGGEQVQNDSYSCALAHKRIIPPLNTFLVQVAD